MTGRATTGSRSAITRIARRTSVFVLVALVLTPGVAGATEGAPQPPATDSEGSDLPTDSGQSDQTSSSPETAPELPAGSQVTVLTKNLEPFIFGESGEPTGFSADLWNEIARRNDWTTAWVWTDEVSDQIQQTVEGNVDAAIGAISMTPDRELLVDFSHRMFSSGLQIMTKPGEPSVWDTLRSSIFTPALLNAFLAITGIIVVVGHVVWLALRRREDFPNGYLRGVGQGMWLIGSSLFVSSRISVVFFQGREPSKVVSRVLVIMWMAIAVVLVSYVTGTITATLTVSELRSSIVDSSDLPGVRVTTVGDTQAAGWLQREGVDFEPVADVEAAIGRIESGRSDAFVFDWPVLKWERFQRPGSGLDVTGEVFDPVPYGIALPQGSPLREQINTSLLEMLADGTYDRILSSYGG